MEIIKDRCFELAERYVKETGVSVFLTGKAGTGKTTFLKSITSDIHKRYVIVAPTGVAAINAGGVTIHSFFQLPLCPYLPDVKELITEYQMPEKNFTLRKERVNILKTLDLLIIDEISMVRADILDAIDYTLRRYRRSERPFGGVQLLMIGDVQQLPPVVKDAEKQYFDQVYPSAFFFNSKALQKVHYVVIELEKIHRQSDVEFMEILNEVRSGSPSQNALNKLNERYKPDFEPEGNWIRLTTHNVKADSVNHSRLDEIKNEPKSFKARIEGEFPENAYPAETELVLKTGAQVMFIRNDSGASAAYYNGKIGTVKQLEPKLIVTDEQGNDIEVQSVDWENIKYEINKDTKEIEGQLEGVFTQIPLRLAWAITIHKSQGLTFDRVIIDAGSAFSFGQVYVALSRCRSLDGIVLASRLTSRCTFENQEVNSFESSYSGYDSINEGLDLYKRKYRLEMLEDAFNLGDLRYVYNRVNRIFQVNLYKTHKVMATRFQELSDADNDTGFAGLKSLKETSEKFRKQISALASISQNSIGEDIDIQSLDEKFSERTLKGAEYFSEQLQFFSEAVPDLLKIETENHEIRKVFNDSAKEMLKELIFRNKLFKEIKGNGFDPSRYQKLKIQSQLSNENTIKSLVKILHESE